MGVEYHAPHHNVQTNSMDNDYVRSNLMRPLLDACLQEARSATGREMSLRRAEKRAELVTGETQILRFRAARRKSGRGNR